MSELVRVSDLSKTYKVYLSPRALLKEVLFGKCGHQKISALQDISFGVSEGEAFGIIGDNGAGKTTLLKILCGTAFATSGTVDVNGSVNALLELGVGFYQEYTGRKNIYANGALMGLSRDRIREREGEIVDFSELGEFIDKPVRTYSSGMQVRLGFATATGFDPEVLIIDEALAVGDQHFQKKCTDRIMSFRRAGKTILFCSHNLYQVKQLCDRAIWLDLGKARAIGPASEVVDNYTNCVRERSRLRGTVRAFNGMREAKEEDRSDCHIERVRLLNTTGGEVSKFRVGDTLVLEVWAYFSHSFRGTPGIVVALVRNDGVVVYVTSNSLDNQPLKQLGSDSYYGRLVFPAPQLLSGNYHFNVGTTDEDNIQCYDIVENAATFSVFSADADRGLTRLDHSWEHG